ncbi:hypothetical protein C437_04875 [Haloarcula vallismortis ATCC 29715]|uniref:Uncharacterized protein n=2 Tax=Haloarcula vallismortis TaxID=28442 RepID=M0JLE5_HALVA|nr:hypothetical protein C437_04875 [Haloarcula vallismortis ATCC 29715]
MLVHGFLDGGVGWFSVKWSFLLRWTGMGCVGAAIISAFIGEPTLVLVNAVLAIILGKAAEELEEGDIDGK